MYQALYRKYRPKNFNEMIGQEVIVKTLQNAINKNKISHAYLFTGPRGTGKTSAAKIFAKTINCENLENGIPCEKCVCCTQINNQQNVDIIEIDAASNNGVDEIRELKNKVNLVPSISKYKVYIIDEVHMLSTSAFNALLKTLEEPPSHVIFILATTDPHKVLPTILSRCQRFDFKKVSVNKIHERLKDICKQENITIEDTALDEISRLANGGLRDALSILDQVNAYSEDKITSDDVHEVNGTITQNNLKAFVLNIIHNKLQEIFSEIDSYDSSGKNFLKLTEELILFYKNILLIKKIPNYFNDEVNKLYFEFLDYIDDEKLISIINELNNTFFNIKNTNNSRLLFELSILKILDIQNNNINKTNQQNIINDSISNTDNLKDEINIKEIKEKSIIDQNIIEKLKTIQNIRINNTLANLKKSNIINLKNKLSSINNLILDPDYGEIVSMLFDGEIKAANDEYIVFVFKTENITNMFNYSLLEVEDFFNKKFNVNYKLIGVSQNNWNYIKTEFNNKEKKYSYVKENFELNEILNNKSKKFNSSIDSMFKNIVEYK